MLMMLLRHPHQVSLTKKPLRDWGLKQPQQALGKILKSSSQYRGAASPGTSAGAPTKTSQMQMHFHSRLPSPWQTLAHSRPVHLLSRSLNGSAGVQTPSTRTLTLPLQRQRQQRQSRPWLSQMSSAAGRDGVLTGRQPLPMSRRLTRLLQGIRS